jgi:hypothetical protein
MNKYSPPWDFSYQMDALVRCVFCLKSDMPMLVRGGETMGVCEPCAVIAHHLWRQAPGEVPPEYPDTAKTEVARVYVLIPKLAKTNCVLVDGKEVHTKADPLLSTSYAFVMWTNEEDGTLDLPGVKVLPGENLRVAAERALQLVKVTTWPCPAFVEPLYTAYTPRGRLAAVMLVTAWRLEDLNAVEDGLNWRPWPLSDQPTPMGGFYKSLETVWKMRLFQHHRASSHTEAISVRVGAAAVNYILLQQRLRAKKPGLDLSMVEIMRRNMTTDEKMIDRLIGEYEVLSTELQTQKTTEAVAMASEEQGSHALAQLLDLEDELSEVEGDDPQTDSEGSVGEGSVLGVADSNPDGSGDLEVADDVAAGENSEDGSESSEVEKVEGPPPEGFARQGRPLTMAKESR